MHPFSGKTLRWFVDQTTLIVALRKEPSNEIDEAMLEELEKLVRELKKHSREIRAIIFCSDQKKGFSAGADLVGLYNRLRSARKKMGLLERVDSKQKAAHLFYASKEKMYERLVRYQAKRFIDRIHKVFDEIDQSPFVTIAAVHGVCFGGGFELALTCDFIVADKSARFCFPELRLGLIPGFGGVPRLERDVGNSVIRDLLFSGRSINAKKAQELGLVSQLVARGEALHVAKKLAGTSALFDASIFRQAKGFVKQDLKIRLEQEKELFLRMMSSKKVFESLEKFANSSDLRPYLP